MVNPLSIFHFEYIYSVKNRELNLKIVRGPVIHSSFNKNGDGTWGENESFYVLDPDNHRIEIFCDMAVINKKGEYINTDNKVVPNTIAEEI